MPKLDWLDNGKIVRGENAIIALRCCCISGKFEDYWEKRAN
jgi:hypothetical protein